MYSTTEKFYYFNEWLDACLDCGFVLSEIVSTEKEYTFKRGGDVVAYWDRELNIGAVSLEFDFT